MSRESGVTRYSHVLIDYDGDEDEHIETEMDFEDLVEIDIDPKQADNWLKVSSAHMSKISRTHIILNLITQIVSWLILTLAFGAAPLLRFRSPDWPDDKSWETSWGIRCHDGDWVWYWKFITGAMDCEEKGFSDNQCRSINFAVFSNNVLLLCYVCGTICAFISMVGTYYQQ